MVKSTDLLQLIDNLYLLSFVETPRKFIIAELSIRKLGSSSVLIIKLESSAIINLRGVSTKLNKYIVFTMQTYKKLIIDNLQQAGIINNLQQVCDVSGCVVSFQKVHANDSWNVSLHRH